MGSGTFCSPWPEQHNLCRLEAIVFFTVHVHVFAGEPIHEKDVLWRSLEVYYSVICCHNPLEAASVAARIGYEAPESSQPAP